MNLPSGPEISIRALIRLLTDADANQVINVPDYTGKSNQTMVQAFAGLTTDLRQAERCGQSHGLRMFCFPMARTPDLATIPIWWRTWSASSATRATSPVVS